MKKVLCYIPYILLPFLFQCVSAQDGIQREVSAADFQALMGKDPAPVVLDVRTAEEFSKGHIPGAINFDWYDSAFGEKVSRFDRNSVLLIYCMSGKRSAAAAEMMRGMGFNEVVNLKGGIMQWRAAGLPEAGAVEVPKGMSRSDFDRLIAGSGTVLFDYYAEWCSPCMKMKPYLEEISKEMAGRVSVHRIDVDTNRQLCKELGVEAPPLLEIYRDGKKVWTHSGFIEKSAVVEQLEKN
ncbi:MAG: hypothetical protein RL213_819 [Bacteroidota bacterium]|jgi:thioredoxin